MKKPPIGYRLNNPGNIVHNPRNHWQGLDAPSFEGRFCRFKHPRYGIRAMAVLLINYQDKTKNNEDPVDTIAEMISRWAPSHENNTDAYIKAVDRMHPRGVLDTLDMHDYNDIMPLIKAIIRHELGEPENHGLVEWYPQSMIDEGLRMAGVVPNAPKPMVKSKTLQGASTAAIGGTGLGILSVVEAAKEAQTLVQPGTILAIALALIIVIGSGWAIYSRLKRRQVEGV